MYVQQQHSLLFFLRKNKKRRDGTVPLCYRLTIDGRKKDRTIKWVHVNPAHWDPDHYRVIDEAPKAKAFNKKIAQYQTDLERLFYVVQGRDEIATPEAVFILFPGPNHS